jgi:membrane-bound inhibitor of C-type lysozyme
MVRFLTRPCIGAAIAILALEASAFATEARYTCSDGTKLTAEFSPPGASKGKVALTFANGRRITLPQVMSADGGRYADNDIEFWIKGPSATLTRSRARETCSTR